MATITKPFTFSAGATVVASEHNTNFDTAYTEFNGNIDNANIKSTAAIVDTKLAQITTASKVSCVALTSLNNTPTGTAFPVGAGGTGATTLSGANLTVYTDTRIKVGTFTRDMTAASGPVTYTGLGFTPVGLVCFALDEGNASSSYGMTDGSTDRVFGIYGTVPTYSDLGANLIYLTTNPGVTSQIAVWASWDASGFTLTWTKQGTPTGTARVNYVAYR